MSAHLTYLRGEKRDLSLKILHQAGFETARQAATFLKRHALTIKPHLSHIVIIYIINIGTLIGI